MARSLPFASRLRSFALWPFGITLTSWHYMWRTTVLHRSETPGGHGDLPPPLDPSFRDEETQPAREGIGPLYHRTYAMRLRETSMTPERLIELLREDPNRASPTEFARFHRVGGGEAALEEHDELIVRMPGPWDGPVRVVDVTPTSFRLSTLDGHLEAGQIEFRASSEDGALCFAIESWARSSDWFSNVLYTRLRMAKEVQVHMWTSFLERVRDLAGGRIDGGIRIETHVVGAP